MRTDSANFAQKNADKAKDPRYVIEVAFDTANTQLWYFTSHTDAALPPSGVTGSILGIVEGLSGTSQTLSPDTANATIGAINFKLVDKASIVTTTLGAQLVLGRSTRKQRVRIYVGFQGLAWADYTLVQTQLVVEIAFNGGAYKFSCADIQRQLRTDLFVGAKTNLALSAVAADITLTVYDTSAFQLLEHGTSYSDTPWVPPAAPPKIGYIKIGDEVIGYTGKTSTTFTGCSRGALNTVAADHPVDTTLTQDRQPQVSEYVYFELPAVKAIYALLNGRVLGTDNLLPHSEAADQWAPNNVTVNVDALTAPDGSATMDTLKENGVSGQHYEDIVFAFAASLPYTFSVFIKPGTSGTRNADIVFYAAAGGQLAEVIVNPVTGAIVSGPTGTGVTGVSAIISPAPSGSWRVALTATMGLAPGTGAARCGLANGTGTNYAGDGASNVGFWGAQLNQTAELLPYARTDAAARTQAVFPTAWNLGIDKSYIRLADFIDPSKGDIYNAVDDLQGFLTLFQDLGKSDGKKFIETELCLLLGAFMPVYADGSLGFRRMANILQGAAYVRMLDESNVVSFGDLVHDFSSLHNLLDIAWNWEPLQGSFTRHDDLLDEDSINTYQPGDPLKLAFRGLYGSRHTKITIAQRFDSLRDRYSSPPVRLTLSVLPSLNALEVGDVVRVRLANVRDYTAPGGGGSLDRSFEIQNIQTDWITGALQLALFGSTAPPFVRFATLDPSVLTAAWYISQGTDLSTVLTITGSAPGHISANGALTGTADINSAPSIYYYNGDLQLDAAKTVTITGNVQLRIKGFFQNNGTISGVGGGLPGAPPQTGFVNPLSASSPGTPGFLGSTTGAGATLEQVGGPLNEQEILSFPNFSGTIVGLNAVVPSFNLSWDGTTLHGVPPDLRGTSGSAGGVFFSDNFIVLPGGRGGNGGAGLLITSRGFSQGASGKINLSGGAGDNTSFFGPGGPPSNGGAGGAPGGLLILLDGAGLSAVGLTDSGFVALNGITPIGNPATSLEQLLFQGDPTFFTSFYVGTGDGTTFPLPSLSGVRGGCRVQAVPALVAPAIDQTPVDQFRDAFLLNNWTQQPDPSTQNLGAAFFAGSSAPYPYVCAGRPARNTGGNILMSHDAALWESQTNPTAQPIFAGAWNGTCYVLVGDAPNAGSGLLLRSTDGASWAQQTPPAAQVALSDIAWVPWLGRFIAVGGATRTGGVTTPGSFIWTSPDGITWTARSATVRGACIAFNGSLVVVGGDAGGTLAGIQTSIDGVTWISATIDFPSGFGLNGLAFGNGIWVGAGGENVVVVSRDGGANWIRGALPLFKVGTGAVRRVRYSGQVFAIAGVAETGTSRGAIVAGRSGTDWVARTGIATSLFGLDWCGNFWLIAGAVLGTNGYIATSIRE